ncbi:MAG: hypothetical protein M3Y71_18280 [Actinomycetota bacterium]|nr:hypothetical protein [Actinomycetota bacterium]
MKRPTLTTASSATTAVVTVLLLSACGGGPATSRPVSTPSPSGTASAQGGAGARRAPATTGLVAQVSGSTMRVQTRTGQTSVTFSASTSVTRIVTGSAAAVTVGSCVLVRDQPGATSTPVAATSVTVSRPVRGRCRTNAFGGGAGAGGAVVGTVTAVQGSALTVVPFVRADGASGSTAPASPGSEVPVTVSTTSATTWAVVERGALADLRVGECVTALGKADDTGTVSATSLSLRPSVGGTCTLGRGGRRSDGGGGGNRKDGGANAPTSAAASA